tara:strand:+ start:225 stop:728 length:504 start_codon:yes stop_codon:yes gene_type:complete
MKIEISKKLKLKIIQPNSKFKDHRGTYLETFNFEKFKNKFKNLKFVEDDFSINNQNVFKGIHGDNKTWKLVSCVYGKCISYIVNCDEKSKNFGKWEKFILSENNYFQILVPPKYGNSFLVKSKVAVYHYKQTQYYQGMKKQFTYKYNDPRIKLNLFSKNLIISDRDK